MAGGRRQELGVPHESEKGYIVLVLFPNSDLMTAKKRPALIVQADNLETNLNQVIIVMITSKMSRAGHPSRVTILIDSYEGQQSGLLTNSVIMTDNLATITLNAVHRIIGSISMEVIDQALRRTLAL